MKSGQIWRRLVMIQLGVTALLALVALCWSGRLAAQSVVLGALVCILPGAWGAKKMFQHQGARAAKRIVSGFYQGEALKIGLSVVLFAVVFISFKIIPLVFFGVYISMQMLLWLAPILFI